jgi:hypothetical protein
MPTATTSKPRKTAKPKSADTCRLSVTIRGVAYTARSAPRPSTLSAFGGCGRRTGPPTPSPTRSTGRRAIAATSSSDTMDTARTASTCGPFEPSA